MTLRPLDPQVWRFPADPERATAAKLLIFSNGPVRGGPSWWGA